VSLTTSSNSPRWRRQAAVVVCTIALAAATGCGSKSSPKTVQTGTVTGTLIYVPGIPTSQPQPTSGEVDLMQNGKVVESTTADASTGGRFTLTDPYGDYQLTAKAGTTNCVTQNVTLGATTVQQDITCQNL
jgi:hypothetical protein